VGLSKSVVSSQVLYSPTFTSASYSLTHKHKPWIEKQAKCDFKKCFVVIGKKSYFGHIFPFYLADCSTLCQKGFCTKRLLVKIRSSLILTIIYKTLQILTSLFTKILKHIYKYKSYKKCQIVLRLGWVKTIHEILPL
jgi:hypothetical protein